MQDATGPDRTVSCHLPTLTLSSRKSKPNCKQDRAGRWCLYLFQWERLVRYVGPVKSHSVARSRPLCNENAGVL